MKYNNDILRKHSKNLLIISFVDVIFIVLVLSVVIYAQDKFNIFKSYSDKTIKPDNYSKKYLRHDIHEYLDENQLKMLRKRTSKDEPNDMFDKNWSGFNNKNYDKMLRKRKDDGVDNDKN